MPDLDAETEDLIKQWLAWRTRTGPLADATRRSYSAALRRLAASKGSLLKLKREDLQDYADERRNLSDNTIRADQWAFQTFFEFAVDRQLRETNPMEKRDFAPRIRTPRSRARLWAGMPRRDLLLEEHQPLFDFLRDTWGRHPELTGSDFLSIRVHGRVPDLVELRSKKRRGQMIPLSPRARVALEKMGGHIPWKSWRTVQRAFTRAYEGQFSPTSLKDMPPVGFGIDLHAAFEGNIREQLTAGQMEDAARAAFVELEDRMRRLVRQSTGRDIHPLPDLVNLLFGDSGPLSATMPANRREPLRMLILGAFGVLRNLVSHSKAVFPSEAYGIDVILVADLAMRLLDPIEHGLRHP